MANLQPEQIYTDVLIIGAGGAGLRAAVAASESDLDVLVLSKVPPTRSHTAAAQGGINAALGNKTPDDWRWHMYDTIRGSDWLGDQDSIAFMCERAPAAIIELEQMGMPFTRSDDGRIYQRAYGGQRTEFGKGDLAYRACAVADRTGHALLHTLYGQALKQHVRFMCECMALDLIMDGNTCRGVLAWDFGSGKLLAIAAQTVILATGGYGQAWAATTSSSICTGDGGGMILRAGLPLQDMEFVQFHPTSLYGSGILITEGARGEGGILRNGVGERFMERYAPATRELASRDVIARAMTQEILEGRGCGPKKDHLHLCLDHLPMQTVAEKLPAVCDITRTFASIDATRDPIPVVPAVHYTMGGVPSNAASQVLNAEGENVNGLLVIGEAACNSVHGANRLGCNALLDLIVFGRAAGEKCTEALQKRSSFAALPPALLEYPLSHFERLLSAKGTVAAQALRREMQAVMQNHAGIFRTPELIVEGVAKIQALWRGLQNDLLIKDRSLLWNNELIAAIETDNLLRQAMVTIAAAEYRRESRGAHWRTDFPERNDIDWLTHSLASMDDSGAISFKAREIRASFIDIAGVSFKPQLRQY